MIGTVRLSKGSWAMRRLLLCLLVAGCSKGPQADLQYVSAARSASAEWALVNEQAERGRLTRHYVETMRQSLREQVQTAKAALTIPQSDYSAEMDSILAEPDDVSPEVLRSHSDRLKTIEDGLESA
jgi:hypothetical protein